MMCNIYYNISCISHTYLFISYEKVALGNDDQFDLIVYSIEESHFFHLKKVNIWDILLIPGIRSAIVSDMSGIFIIS